MNNLDLVELNPHLTCKLCSGYLVDATTIIECLHSFCKTCVVQHLEKSKFCPTCDVQVHKTRPLENIRADKTLQSLVYKLVPGLLISERQKRKDFYDENASQESPLERSVSTFADITENEVACYASDVKHSANDFFDAYTPDPTPEENISLCLQHCDRPPPFAYDETSEQKCDKRYLLCPSALTIGLLKKFLLMKFELPDYYQISIYHSDQSLANVYTLIDIISIYTWRRAAPLRLYYTVWDGSSHTNQMTPPCPAKVINTDMKCIATPSRVKRKLSELSPEEKRELKRTKLEKLRKRTKKLKIKLKKTNDERLKERLKKKLKLKKKIAGELEMVGDEGDELERILRHSRKQKKRMREKMRREEEKEEKIEEQIVESVLNVSSMNTSAESEVVSNEKKTLVPLIEKMESDIIPAVNNESSVNVKSNKENITQTQSQVRNKLRHSKRKTAMDTKKKLLTRRILRRRTTVNNNSDKTSRLTQLKMKLSRLKRNLSNHDKPGWLRSRRRN